MEIGNVEVRITLSSLSRRRVSAKTMSLSQRSRIHRIQSLSFLYPYMDVVNVKL